MTGRVHQCPLRVRSRPLRGGPISLRARVAVAAALGALVIVTAIGVYVALAISRNNLFQLDRRLEIASEVVVSRAPTFEMFLGNLSDSRAFGVTIRDDSRVRATTRPEIPQLPLGSATTNLAGVDFRVFTAAVPDDPATLVSIAVPLAEARDVSSSQQRSVVLGGAIAVTAAAALGWVFGGRAVRPLTRLTEQVRAQPPVPPSTRTGVREADELAAAVGGMLERLSEARTRTEAALDTARDFAAVSAHELRTPLTAMRTDIEVLRTLDLDDAQRREILADLDRTQGRVEATLSALERLASGELSRDDDRVEVDLTDIADIAAQDAMRHHPGLTVHVDAAGPVPARIHPTGLRLALDNALVNAVHHGSASMARIAIATEGPDVTITVDDDGTGVPTEDRERVFGRFERGTNSATRGSGLGLALVAQQAELHGGTASFEDGEGSGARLVLRLRGVSAQQADR